MINVPFKICFVGAAGSGKTAIASQTAAILKAKGLICEPVLEYARFYIENCGHPSDIGDQIIISKNQMEAESLKHYCDIVVCDSAAFLAYIYALLSRPRSRLKLRRYEFLLGDAWKLAISSLPTYNLVFYVPPIYKATIDRVRSWQRLEQIKQTDRQIRAFLELHQIDFKSVAGESLKARSESVWTQLRPEIKHLLKERGRL